MGSLELEEGLKRWPEKEGLEGSTSLAYEYPHSITLWYFQSYVVPIQQSLKSIKSNINLMNRAHSDPTRDIFLFTNDSCIPSLLQA